MKKQITSVTFFLMLMLLFAACSSDDDTQPTIDTNNEAPVFNAQTFIAAEDIADDTVIGTVSATDPEEDNLTFLLTQNNEDLFELTSTGELSLAAGKNLDFEKETSYAITVEVSDGINKASAVISITVENVVEPFITTWETTMANEEIVFDINPDFTYDYTIDWGDGTIEDNQTTAGTHTYATVGTYTISISGTLPTFLMVKEDGEDVATSASKLQTIEAWGDIKWESMANMFRGCVNMTYNAKDIPDLSKVTDMSLMFLSCSKFTADLNQWDVSNIIDMPGMFNNATVFNGDISTWNVSKVTNMKSMFSRATSFNGDLSAWDVGNVIDMGSMFSGAAVFNGNLSSWDVSNVTNMGGLFSGATVFNGDLSAWDVSNVTEMTSMFSQATSFNGDVSAWNVSKVTNMNSMFNEASSFNKDLDKWDISNVTDTRSMFAQATVFNGDVSTWDVSKVENMSSMFRAAISFNVDISQWQVTRVTDMRALFQGATSFSADLSTWDISNVTNMAFMLSNTNISLTNYDKLLTAWAALPSLQSNVALGADGLEYCGGTTGRNTLVNNKGWTITGDSVSGSCA